MLADLQKGIPPGTILGGTLASLDARPLGKLGLV